MVQVEAPAVAGAVSVTVFLLAEPRVSVMVKVVGVETVRTWIPTVKVVAEGR